MIAGHVQSRNAAEFGILYQNSAEDPAWVTVRAFDDEPDEPSEDVDHFDEDDFDDEFDDDFDELYDEDLDEGIAPPEELDDEVEEPEIDFRATEPDK
ncbi:MAG: hypothetical protein O2931_09865 [Planctomycetota bacterium]|nr:hypothetical protein [Planctomycetota bacterium]MDA1179086.1 hypothetical protein [Planctomycetota bacterium]